MPIETVPSAPPSTTRLTSLSNTALEVKPVGGNLWGWNLINSNSTDAFVKFYDKAAAGVVVGTDIIVKTIIVPSNGSVLLDAGHPQRWFNNAIAVAATTDIADTDTTAPTLPIYSEVQYK